MLCLADFIYLIQYLSGNCFPLFHLGPKYPRIIMPATRLLNQVNKMRESEL